MVISPSWVFTRLISLPCFNATLPLTGGTSVLEPLSICKPHWLAPTIRFTSPILAALVTTFPPDAKLVIFLLPTSKPALVKVIVEPLPPMDVIPVKAFDKPTVIAFKLRETKMLLSLSAFLNTADSPPAIAWPLPGSLPSFKFQAAADLTALFDTFNL